MKTYGGMEPLIFDLHTKWKWSASRPGRFIPEESWVTPGRVWTTWRKFLPYRVSNSEPLAIQLVASRYANGISQLLVDMPIYWLKCTLK
jgi:hypothetical protein